MAQRPPRLSIPPLPSSTSLMSDESIELHWDNLTLFYLQNKLIIEKTLRWDLGSSSKNERARDIENVIESILETTETILDGLFTLAVVHPVLGVAIYAFQSIVKLDLARRDNSRKALPVMAQMQTMMCTMFQLQKPDSFRVSGKAETVADRPEIQALMQVIANDIKKCGSDLDYYMGRGFLAKIASAKTYERRFKEHIETFSTRRAELQGLVTAYIANGLDTAITGIHSIQQELSSSHNELYSHIDAVFQELQTQHEKDILRIMKIHGGAANCFSKDELLSELVQISPSASFSALTEVNGKPMDLQGTRKALAPELEEGYLEEALARHGERFEKLLNVQSNNTERLSRDLGALTRTQMLILEQGKLIKNAVITNIKLEDKDLQNIWERMSLKRSVKAKNFVLTLRDHILPDRSRTPSPTSTTSTVPETTTLYPDSLVVSSPMPHSGLSLNGIANPDEWVLEILDVTHVQPIVEAIDEDQSGFISVKEANKFALSRPKGWSLLRWIAYWAAGWHINITNYRNKIYSIMIELHELGFSTLPVNRAYVANYLNYYPFLHVEGFLRSTIPLPDDTRKDPKMTEIAESMADIQEQILLKNLKEVSFVIESPLDARLIVGRASRVETWIYPLLYLVLNHHLAILKVAERRTLHEDEMDIHSTTLKVIFFLFDERMKKLSAIFRQKYRDVEAQFENHAYSMFLTTFKGTELDSDKNSLVTSKSVSDPSERSGTALVPDLGPIETSILCKGTGPTFEFEDFEGGVPVDCQPTQHVLQGDWTGVCFIPDYPSFSYPANSSLTLRIQSIDKHSFKGKGEALIGLYDIKGQFVPNGCDSAATSVSFSISVSQNGIQETILNCTGNYDPQTATMSGHWTGVIPPSDDAMDMDNGPIDDPNRAKQEDWCPEGFFIFSKYSPDIFRLRHILDGPWVNSSWNPARKRWAFAIAAILVQVQRRMGSLRLFNSRLSERRRWIELSTRQLLDDIYNMAPNTRRYLSDKQKEELRLLTRSTPPENARLYGELTEYIASRLSFDIGDIECDVCSLRIVFTRFLCITCIEEDMSNQIDLCAECIGGGSLSGQRKFVHQHSHSLIRCSRQLNCCELPSMISMARLRSQRIQASFLASEARKLETKDTKQKAFDGRIQKDANMENPVLVKSRVPLIDLICYFCGETLGLPCWACTTCALDTLICLNCEAKGEFPRSLKDGARNMHSTKHPLIRISSSVESRTTGKEDKANQLGEQLRDLEAGINNGLSALEEKMNKSIDALKSDMKNTSNVPVKNAEEISISSSTEGHSVSVSSDSQTQNDNNLDGRLAVLETKVDSLIQMMQDVLISSRRETGSSNSSRSDFVPYWSRSSAK